MSPWDILIAPPAPPTWNGPTTVHILGDQSRMPEIDAVLDALPAPKLKVGRPPKWQPWTLVTPETERALRYARNGFPLLEAK